ncbi:hypothetical protein BH23GEM1_BH23GEM1_12280 [soil metagenome]
MADVLRPAPDAEAPWRAASAAFGDLFANAPSSDVAGECAPPMDLLELAQGIEVLMDLPGVKPADVRIVFAHGTLIIAGRKFPATCAHREAAFHLAERTFGRFVRAIRLTGALDAGRASATLSGGELRVMLPRIAERRGLEIRIPLTAS